MVTFTQLLSSENQTYLGEFFVVVFLLHIVAVVERSLILHSNMRTGDTGKLHHPLLSPLSAHIYINTCFVFVFMPLYVSHLFKHKIQN